MEKVEHFQEEWSSKGTKSKRKEIETERGGDEWIIE